MDASDLIMISVDDHVVEPRGMLVEHWPAKLWEQLAWGMTLVISPTPWTAAATVMVQGATCYFEAQAELLAEALDAMTEWIAAA